MADQFMQLEEFRKTDVRTVDKKELVDIKNIKINPAFSKEERMAQYMEQVKNPFCFICEGIIVKTNFSETKDSLEDKLSSYFMSL